ncbi:MAG: hypothetical protein JJT75_01705 [Opitutales bacterium]|nr:hypothetical protein [Opitutales bacterium]
MRLKFRQVISAKDRAMNQPDYANSQSGRKAPPTQTAVQNLTISSFAKAMADVSATTANRGVKPLRQNSHPNSHDFLLRALVPSREPRLFYFLSK